MGMYWFWTGGMQQASHPKSLCTVTLQLWFSFGPNKEAQSSLYLDDVGTCPPSPEAFTLADNTLSAVPKRDLPVVLTCNNCPSFTLVLAHLFLLLIFLVSLASSSLSGSETPAFMLLIL